MVKETQNELKNNKNKNKNIMTNPNPSKGKVTKPESHAR